MITQQTATPKYWIYVKKELDHTLFADPYLTHPLISVHNTDRNYWSVGNQN